MGRNNIKAQVSAEVDFTQTESTSEQHRPNLSSDASAIRSQQVIENGGTTGTLQPSGVPGATSNQPPAASTAPINGAAPQLAAAGQQGGMSGGLGPNAKRELVTNYEVDKTVRVTRGGSGNVKRLSAAVVLNYQPVADDKGVMTGKALSPEQLEQMTALVRETIGFNKDRGDSVNLMNAPFQVDATSTDDLPLWKQPETLELARNFAWPVGLSLFAALVVLGLVRPALKAMSTPPPILEASGQLDALEADQPQRPALAGPESLEPTVEQMRLEDARALALANPMAVANIMKNWVNGEAA